MKTLAHIFICSMLALVMTGFGLSQDLEPNNSCLEAGNLTGAVLPLTIQASLDPNPSTGDMDFFRFTTPPQRRMLVQAAPDPNSQTPLQRPLIGIWDSECNLWTTVQGYPDVYLDMRMPEGEFVIGVTGEYDWWFEVGGQGAYILSVSEVAFIGSISGRVVDAETGQPLMAGLEVYHCPPSGCNWVNWATAQEDGIFYVSSDYWGDPLPAGSYQLVVNATPYQQGSFGPFEVGEDEHLDVGDLELVPFKLIGSVYGRLVDALSEAPLPYDLFYPWMHLVQCQTTEYGYDSCYSVAYTAPDEQGRFVFIGPYITVGRFYILAWADQYQPLQTDFFEVGEGEHYDTGNLLMQPLPIQFLRMEPCSTIPARGGNCKFKVQVRNGSNKRLAGAAWAQIGIYGTGSPHGYSQFQIGKLGTKNPQPQPFNLKGGQTLPLDFSFEVPGTVAPGASICGEVWAGGDPNPHINTLGNRFLFCVSKTWGGFELVTGARAHEMKRERERGAGPPPRSNSR